MVDMTPAAPDLGAYILPGKVLNPKDGVVQAVEFERMGLGTVWAAERWETKEIGALLGAISQVTTSVRIGAGCTYFVPRHPVVTAGMAATLQGLSGNRLILGFARSFDQRWRDMGLPIQTAQLMTDYVSMLRRLWAGETVSYESKDIRIPKMSLADIPSITPPLVLAAMGPKSLELAGRIFDGVILHGFLTVEGGRRSVEIVRQAAVSAGRKPTDVTIYAHIVVAPDLTSAEAEYYLWGKAAFHSQYRMLSEWIIKFNQWSPAPAEAMEKMGLAGLEWEKADPAEVHRRMYEAGKKVIPREWIEDGYVMGSSHACAAKLKQYRAAGVDEIILDCVAPEKLSGLVRAYVRCGS
jgi:5,10-methylenetetrahydromethanopterin reductase